MSSEAINAGTQHWSQARWQGEGGCRLFSQLEGTVVALAIGTEISLIQSGKQPQQEVVAFAVSAVLTPTLEAQRLFGPGYGPMVLIERPRQGCTVVSSELVSSLLGARTGVGGGAATGAGEGVTPPASQD